MILKSRAKIVQLPNQGCNQDENEDAVEAEREIEGK